MAARRRPAQPSENKSSKSSKSSLGLDLDGLAELIVSKIHGLWPIDRGGAQERDIFSRQEHTDQRDLTARVTDIATQTRNRDAGQSEAGEADELARLHHTSIANGNNYVAGLQVEHLLTLAAQRERANQLATQSNYAAHLADLGQAQNHVPDTEIGREALNQAVAQLATAAVPINIEKLREDMADLAKLVLELKGKVDSQS